jgi:CheY-like chemotaxis protein
VADAIVPPEKPVEAEPEEATVGLAGKKILIVDDDPDTLEFLSTVLTDNGCETITAGDGDKAIEMARVEKPDLITLDMWMPGKTGVDVFVELRNDPELADTMICVISGRPEFRKVIYDRPVRPPEGYMDKPVTEESLLLNLRKIFELSKEAKAPTT